MKVIITIIRARTIYRNGMKVVTIISIIQLDCRLDQGARRSDAERQSKYDAACKTPSSTCVAAGTPRPAHRSAWPAHAGRRPCERCCTSHHQSAHVTHIKHGNHLLIEQRAKGLGCLKEGRHDRSPSSMGRQNLLCVGSHQTSRIKNPMQLTRSPSPAIVRMMGSSAATYVCC